MLDGGVAKVLVLSVLLGKCCIYLEFTVFNS